ncbi:MAG: hypothetical protein K2G86_09455 [Prevotella sp.]|nr:hypothetical protein [Prevotella sp.]
MENRKDEGRLPVSHVFHGKQEENSEFYTCQLNLRLEENRKKTERQMNSFSSFPLFFPRFAVSLQGIGSKPA